MHIEALEGFGAAVSEADQPGVESLVARLREEQAGANATVARALEEMERSDLRGRLDALCAAAGAVA